MKRLVLGIILGCAFASALAQEPPIDCTVGRLEVGGPAPKITSKEYMVRAASEWFDITGARHHESLIRYGKTPYHQFIAVKEGRLLAVIREFQTSHTVAVMSALSERYGPSSAPSWPWVIRMGYSSEAAHVTWFDADCGIRIDAFPSVDPEDPDERFVVVWTKGLRVPAPSAADAIR